MKRPRSKTQQGSEALELRGGKGSFFSQNVFVPLGSQEWSRVGEKHWGWGALRVLPGIQGLGVGLVPDLQEKKKKNGENETSQCP